MKILITSEKTPISYSLAFLLKDNPIVFGELNYPLNQFPKVDSISFPHQLLTYCLDQGIEKVFPVREGEIKSLMVTKVLFTEFGIELMIPDFLHEFSIDNLVHKINSYAELSSKLLALGYPNKKFALGNANQMGDLIFVNDKQKNWNQIWSKIEDISFVQMGKIFNQVNFDPLLIYQVENDLKQTHILIENSQIKFLDILPADIKVPIQDLLIANNANGLYQIYLSENKVIRIKNVAN